MGTEKLLEDVRKRMGNKLFFKRWEAAFKEIGFSDEEAKWMAKRGKDKIAPGWNKIGAKFDGRQNHKLN